MFPSCCCLTFFFSSRRRHTRWNCDWSSDVCSSDLHRATPAAHSHPVKIYNVGIIFYVWPIEDDARANVTVQLEDCSGEWRSEERRVGKECGVRGSPER